MIKKVKIEWSCAELAQKSKMQKELSLLLTTSDIKQSAAERMKKRHRLQENTDPSTLLKLVLGGGKLMLVFLIYFEPVSTQLLHITTASELVWGCVAKQYE